MIILGLETSCDETGAAVVEKGRKILSNALATQVEHQRYSGVVPELASRAHVALVNSVIEKALKDAKAFFNSTSHSTGGKKVNAIAVTVGPGLVGSLLVGKMAAEALGWVFDVPVYGVNHIEGHLLSPLLLDNS